MGSGDFRFISIAKANHPSRFDRTTAFLPNRSSPFIYGDMIGMLGTNAKGCPGQNIAWTTTSKMYEVLLFLIK